MDEDQWYALAKSQQSAAWKDGYDTARTACLAILDGLRADIEALRDKGRTRDWDYFSALDDVLKLIDGGSDD